MDKYFFNILILYILRRILFSFLFFLAIFSSVLVFVSFIQYADIFIAAGVTFSSVLKVLVLMLPLSVEFALPLSFMSSLLYVIYVMGVKNEILSIELTGNSRFIAGIPVIIFAVVVFLLNLVFSTLIFPSAINRIKSMATEFAGKNIRNSLSENRINDDIPDTVIYFQKREAEDRYKNLFVFQKKEEGDNLLIYSREATLDFGKKSLSIAVKMSQGSIIDLENMLLRYIEFAKGNLTIDVSDIIEKKVKNIRGFYQTGSHKEKGIHLFDGLYLAMVNLWIAVLSLFIFLNRTVQNSFLRYLLFFMLIAFFYVGFRFYHSLFESGFMQVGQAFCCMLSVMVLILVILRRVLLSR